MSDWVRRSAASLAGLCLAACPWTHPTPCHAASWPGPVASSAPAADSLTAPARPDSLAPARASAPASFPAPLRTRGIDGLPISRVEVHPLNIYDPVPPGRLAALYRLANRLHIRTRERTLRGQLLFAEGDLWSEEVARENERNLRALDFLYPSRIRTRVERDSVVATVETHDIWTTSPEFNLESADGNQYGSISFTERNLVGLGKSVSVEFRKDAVGSSRSLSYDDPGVGGTHARFHFGAGDAAGGANGQISLGIPFYAQNTRTAFGASWYRNTFVSSLFQGGVEVASLNQRVEETEIHWGWGAKRDLTIQRLVASFSARDRRFGPSRLDPGAPPEFAGGEESLFQRRIAIEGRLWRPQFVERTSVRRMVLTEDIDLGANLALKLGMSPRFLGSTADESYAVLRAGIGAEQSWGFGWVNGSLETRIRHEPREMVQRVDARWYTGNSPRQRLVLGVLGIQGTRVDRDFQLVFGGLNGLRAYPVHAVAGRRGWRFNLEERRLIGENYWNLFTVGAVVFLDAARAWGPGAAGAGWYSAGGGGVRIALPQWSLSQVIRVDVAWPLDPTRDGQRRPVLTFGSSQAF